MDAFRASSGNNEYTRLLFIKKLLLWLFITHFRFVKGRRNQNDSISADPAVKKRGPVSKPVDLDETQIQFESNPGTSGKNFESYFSSHCG